MKSEYDNQANEWKRNTPSYLSDFVARKEVFRILKKISPGKIVLDLGCGEGYVDRKVALWAKKVIGVDISKGMIKLAKIQEKEDPLGITYYVRDVRKTGVPSSSINLCIGNFICNHLSPKDLVKFYSEISRVLEKKGKFVLAFPHPASYFLIKGKHSRFKIKNFDYIKSRGKCFKIMLQSVKGRTSVINTYHSNIEDHFNGISLGKLAVESILEPIVPIKLTKKYPLYKGLEGKTPYMILIGRKT
ncbi:MAG: class I SAM-dependent methyltransferase [Nanoarchaeota archaeon]|nr:class I SAM-dependent methyltransferase [Nanoarchaeota archaeon]